MNKFTNFIKIAITYFVGNVLSKLLAFLLIPLYTSCISTDNYGIYDMAVSIISLIVPIVFFQIWDGMFRFVYDYKEKKDKYCTLNNGLIVSFVGIALYEVIFIITGLFIEIPNSIFINIYGITIAMQYIFGTMARTLKENKLYMYTGVINSLVNLSMNVTLILFMNYRETSVLYTSVILGNLIQCIIIGAKLNILKNFRKKDISREIIVKMIKFSIPIAISTISYWLLAGYSKVIVSQKLGYDMNGIFAIANKLASMIVIVVSVFQMSWHETSFEVAKDENKREFYERGLNVFFVILMLTAIIIIPITKILFPYLVKENYSGANVIIPLVYIYSAINSFAGFSSSQFLAEKNSKVTLYTTMTAALLNVILSYVLTVRYGLIGTSIALLISFTVNAALRMILLKKLYNIKLNKKNLLVLSAVLLISTIIYYMANVLITVIFIIVLLIIVMVIFREQIKRLLLILLKKQGGADEENSNYNIS